MAWKRQRVVGTVEGNRDRYRPLCNYQGYGCRGQSIDSNRQSFVLPRSRCIYNRLHDCVYRYYLSDLVSDGQGVECGPLSEFRITTVFYLGKSHFWHLRLEADWCWYSVCYWRCSRNIFCTLRFFHQIAPLPRYHHVFPLHPERLRRLRCSQKMNRFPRNFRGNPPLPI